MKTDRLYSITLYLLNHGKYFAIELAKYFEVSVRTIQRDIDTLCQAGIPVCALRLNDVEDKWVAAKAGMTYTKEEIEKAVEFQERFFDSEIIM